LKTARVTDSVKTPEIAVSVKPYTLEGKRVSGTKLGDFGMGSVV
jgi:hypothetical protein